MSVQRSSHLSKKAYDKLALRLPFDYIDKVNELSQKQFSRSYISKVKTGKRYDESIIKILFQIAEEEDSKKKSLEAVAKGKKKLEETEL